MTSINELDDKLRTISCKYCNSAFALTKTWIGLAISCGSRKCKYWTTYGNTKNFPNMSHLDSLFYAAVNGLSLP